MRKRPPPNASKPWTKEGTTALRRLVRAGTPYDDIAHQLGRTPRAVSDHAAKIGIKPPHRGNRPVEERKAVPPPTAADDRPKPPAADHLHAPEEDKPTSRFPPLALSAGTAEPDFRLMVVRRARPTRPWIWEIQRDGEAAPRNCSTMGYRSAEDAWVAGKAVLTDFRRRSDPKR